jgi:hypothetical protein
MASTIMIFKERIANMSNDIEDKEIIAYAKNILKEIKEENKKKKVEDAEKIKKKRVPKKVVAKNLDEEGNEIPKKLNKYQQFMKDNQQRIKEENPGLSNTERFAKLAEEWNEHKKANIKDEKTDESESEKEVQDEPVEKVKETKKKGDKKVL